MSSCLLVRLSSVYDPVRKAPPKPSGGVLTAISDMFTGSAAATTAHERQQLCVLKEGLSRAGDVLLPRFVAKRSPPPIFPCL